jgi:hypothetical protein
MCVATPLWVRCEDETHIPKSGNLESSGIPKNSELDYRGQNTSHWGVLYTIRKFLKCRCPKWPRMSHLDICNPSYGQKKGRESNWQSDSWPLKVGNRLLSDVCRRSATRLWKALKESYKISLDLTPIRGPSKKLWMPKVPGAQSPGSPNRDSFGTPLWESWEKVPFGCSLRRELQRILYGGRWWLPSSSGCGE